MRVWTLRGVCNVGLGSFGDLHIKTNRQILGRIAGGIVTGLIFERAAHDVFPRLDRVERADEHVDLEVSGINIELLVGREGEAHILSIRISGFSDYDVGSGFYFQRSWNQVFRFRMIGINVVSVGDIERQSDSGRFALNGGHDGCARDLHDRTLRSELFLR